MNITDVTELTTFAAGQSDRWMFVALLVIGMVVALTSGVWMTRYFTAELKAARLEFQQLSKDFTAHLLESNKELASLIAKNTDAMNRVTSKL